MQASSRHKNDKGQSSRFVEGRLKLSTSCTECHRRKQKCDKKQPCKHCARRFPAPTCVYLSTSAAGDASLTGPNAPLSAPSSVETTSQILRPPLSRVDSNKSTVTVSTFEVSADVENVASVDQQDAKLSSGNWLSARSFDNWGPSEYQDLLTTMVGSIEVDSQEITSPTLAGQISESVGSGASRSTSAELAQIPVSRGRSGSRTSSMIGRPSNFSITSVEPLHFLGITPTYKSGELLQAFLKVISKYVFSIDGSPKPNYYNDIWLPWCVKSPLLAYLGIFTASCYQSEAQKIPPTQSQSVLAYKVKSINLLNQMLRDNDRATSSEAITAVTYLVTNEWYWSNFENVQAHMKGLKEMVRLRGGLGDLGHDGFLRKMILLLDYHIACSYDLDLNFPHNIYSHIRYPASISTPLNYSLVTFSSINQDLDIAMETALILDDMRFMLMAVLRLLDTPQTEEELRKLTTTSEWIQTRILSLPDGTDPASQPSNDHIYKSVRLAALIYSRSIIQRTPLSKACTLKDLNLLWASMWRVTLTRWKQIPGIFVWVILAGNQAAQETAHGRFLKSMFKAATSYMALDHFEVVDAALMNYARLQRWLRQGREVVVSMPDVIPAPMDFLHNYKN